MNHWTARCVPTCSIDVNLVSFIAMPDLLAPAALWALAVLGLPLAVHLWRQPPRTVQLGSLRFLRDLTVPRWSHLRWRELLLLSVRLALLAMLIVLLARPVWRRSPPRHPQRWVLIDPAATLGGPELTRLQHLQAVGFEARSLTKGFPPVYSFARAQTSPVEDVWSLLREADASLPPGSSLTVFSADHLVSFSGVRPALHSRLEWLETSEASATTSRTWLESVQPAIPPGEEPVTIVGTTDAARIAFSASPPPGGKLERHPDAIRLVNPDGIRQPWVPVPAPAPLRVLILHDPERAEDARFLSAAVQAALTGANLALHVDLLSTDTKVADLPVSEWTFWLSAHAPPASVLTRATALFEDAPEADQEIDGWILPQAGAPGNEGTTFPLRLWRRGASGEEAAVWTDEHGAALLTRRESTLGPRWHFASRFHPAWTDLPLTTAFPLLLRQVLQPGMNRPKYDLRRVTAEQAQPNVSTAAFHPLAPLDASVDLQSASWILAAGLFALERVLSHFQPRPRTVAALDTPQPALA